MSVLNYNDAAATARCITSLSEACAEGIPTFIVGDHSPESQIHLIQDRLPKDARLSISFHHRPHNPGFGAGHNANFKSRKWNGSELFLVINNDVEVEDPDLISTMISHCAPRTIVGCTITSRPEGGVWFGGGRFSRITGDLVIRRSVPPAEVTETEVVCGCCLLLRAEDFDAMQGFDEKFFMYAEDVDLSIRSAARGFRRLLVSKSLGHYVGSGHSGKYSSLYLYENTKNRLICLQRYRLGLPWIRIAYFFSKYLVLRIAQLLVFSDHPVRQSRLVCQAFVDGLRASRSK